MKRRRKETKRESNSSDASPHPTTANNNSLQHENVIPPWTSLNNDILSHCFSYCNVADLLSIKRTCGIFRQAARMTVSQATWLHLSVLLSNNPYKRCYNDEMVARLLEDAGDSLQRIEMCGLRNLKGGEWAYQFLMRCANLESLDCGGCTNLSLSPLSSEDLREHCPNIRHVNFSGCKQIDPTVLTAWRGDELETLCLGGFSQRFDNEALLTSTCFPYPRLCTLDLSGLKRITTLNELLLLPDTLECLVLAGCDRLHIALLESLSVQVMQPLMEERLGEGTLQELSHLVQSGNMNEFWSLLYPSLDDATRQVVVRMMMESSRVSNHSGSVIQTGWPKLRVLDVSHVGIALGSGINTGFISLVACLSGGSLMEVNVTGCDNVKDKDIAVLASTCKNLTCLEARACRIGDEALIALGKESEHLACLDVSACFDITDDGVAALCPAVGTFIPAVPWGVYYSAEVDQIHGAERRGCPALRSLKLSSLPNVTDDVLFDIGGMRPDEGGFPAPFVSTDSGLKKLVLLDIRDCTGLSGSAFETIMKHGDWPSLVEVDARGIAGRVSREHLPGTLRFLNGRSVGPSLVGASHHKCCTVMQNSQRLKASQGITLQPMYHCLDCKLLPCSNRGMCAVCAKVCHKKHRIFFGSMARFYCDCAFGVAGGDGCKSLVPQESEASQRWPMSCTHSRFGDGAR